MADVSKSLVWKGDALTAKMRTAQIAGVNRTMGACVTWSRSNHPWQNRTGILEGSINVVDYAAPDANGVKGVWGVQDAAQALILELGGTIVPREKQALKFKLPDGSWRIVKSVTIPPYPYLRPSADLNYPALAENIRAAFDAPAGGASQ